MSQTQHQKSRAAFAFYSESTAPDKKERRGEKKRSPALVPALLFPSSFSRGRRGKKDEWGRLVGWVAEGKGRGGDGCRAGKAKKRKIEWEEGFKSGRKRGRRLFSTRRGEGAEERGRTGEQTGAGGREDESEAERVRPRARVVKETERDRGEIRTMRL